MTKDDPRLEACGTIDELSAVLGLTRSLKPPPEIDEVLDAVQHDLLVLGAEVACAPGAESTRKARRLSGSDIERLEQYIDAADRGLPKLSGFVLPGGRPAAAALHVARTVARRAERAFVSATSRVSLRAELLAYLNRLSDLLFVLARKAGTPTQPEPKAHKPGTT